MTRENIRPVAQAFGLLAAALLVLSILYGLFAWQAVQRERLGEVAGVATAGARAAAPSSPVGTAALRDARRRARRSRWVGTTRGRGARPAAGRGHATRARAHRSARRRGSIDRGLRALAVDRGNGARDRLAGRTGAGARTRRTPARARRLAQRRPRLAARDAAARRCRQRPDARLRRRAAPDRWRRLVASPADAGARPGRARQRHGRDADPAGRHRGQGAAGTVLEVAPGSRQTAAGFRRDRRHVRHRTPPLRVRACRRPSHHGIRERVAGGAAPRVVRPGSRAVPRVRARARRPRVRDRLDPSAAAPARDRAGRRGGDAPRAGRRAPSPDGTPVADAARRARRRLGARSGERPALLDRRDLSHPRGPGRRVSRRPSTPRSPSTRPRAASWSARRSTRPCAPARAGISNCSS
jgi:hypothetical protein